MSHAGNTPSDSAKTPGKSRVESDAKGQFAVSQGDRNATGVASAKPTVITPGHSEDATVHRLPPGDHKPGGAEFDPKI